MRVRPFGPILEAGPRSPQTDPPGGPVILLALLLPVVMMAFLFAADALEDLIFPPPAAPAEDAPAADIAEATSP
ncbi:predicted protein [Streptomyces lividans TK24]|nr:predicted protein [Streptomyces lividans TK24]